MKNRKTTAWERDLFPLLHGLGNNEDSVIFTLSGECPILRMLNWEKIQKFFVRFELQHLLEEHLEEFRAAAGRYPDGGESRMMREFTYGFTINNPYKRKYTIFAFIWYFRSRQTPMDAVLTFGIASAGAEGLVAAKIKELSDYSFSLMRIGASHSEFQATSGPQLNISN